VHKLGGTSRGVLRKRLKFELQKMHKSRGGMSGERNNYVVGEITHAAGEARHVGLQLAVRVALLVQPAVVHVDVLVAHRRVALGHHQIGHSPEKAVTEHRQ